MISAGTALIWGLCGAFGAACAFSYFAMIGQVNRILADTEQIRYFGTPPGKQFLKMRRVFREHRRLYPTSRLPLVCLLFWLAGVATGLIWFFWFAPAA